MDVRSEQFDRIFECLNDIESEEEWDDAESVILDRVQFATDEVASAMHALNRISAESYGAWAALHVLAAADSTGGLLQAGMCKLLGSSCESRLKLVCRFSGKLPESLSPEFCQALRDVDPKIRRGLYVFREEFQYRALMKRCKKQLGLK